MWTIKIDIKPSDMRTVKLRKSKKKNHSYITLPADLVQEKELEDGESIVICYVCRSGEQKG